jgi:hypothetical protein
MGLDTKTYWLNDRPSVAMWLWLWLWLRGDWVTRAVCRVLIREVDAVSQFWVLGRRQPRKFRRRRRIRSRLSSSGRWCRVALIRTYLPEDDNRHSYRRGNLKSYIIRSRLMKTWYVIRRFNQWDCFNSVTRRRLAKAEDPSACVPVNRKLWKSKIALYLNVIKRTCKQSANKSNHPNQNLSFSSRVPPYMWQYYCVTVHHT